MGRRRDADDDPTTGGGAAGGAPSPVAAAGEERLIREFSTLRRELEAVSKALVRSPDDERRLARKGIITERLRALSVKMSAVGMKGHHDARSPASDVDAVGSYRASSDTDDEGHCADLPRRPRVARSATCRAKKTAPDLTLMTVEEMQAESLALTKEVAKLRRKADRTDAEDARMAEARDRLESLADRILDGDGQGSADNTNGAPPKSIFGRMMHKKKATPGGSSRRSASSKAADSDSEDDASLAGDDDKSSSRGGSKKSGVKGGRAKKGSPGSGSKADGSGSSVTASPTQSPSARLGKAGSPPSKSASNSSLTAADARAGRKAKKAAAEEAAKVKAGAGRVGDAMGSAKERMARRGEKLAAMDANASTMKDESSAMAVAARALRAKQEKSDKRGGFF
ncbi:hypothetical protein I4F81_005762 [Pyropia yezoensis]|uniref:Uncharacterized protein n=1 Tax=Pyropia yezoensis TaxID=2788 RepID=A0ACC3BZU7_PYRYE|nr:hypothetical protein I4F81_005762 [Neopyropia yezoensis]